MQLDINSLSEAVTWDQFDEILVAVDEYNGEKFDGAIMAVYLKALLNIKEEHLIPDNTVRIYKRILTKPPVTNATDLLFKQIIPFLEQLELQLKSFTNGRHSLFESDKEVIFSGGYKMFKLNRHKIEVISQRSIIGIEKQFKELVVDIVEALAEYNIHPSLIASPGLDIDGRELYSNEKFLSRFTVPSAHEGVPFYQELISIFFRAQETLKGELFVKPFPMSYLKRGSPFILPLPVQEGAAIEGPYVNVGMRNPESNVSWARYNRYRAWGGFEHLHFNLLAEKKEGDRLILDKGNKKEQVLLRINQSASGSSSTLSFEAKLVSLKT